jgi:hypothetical protein
MNKHLILALAACAALSVLPLAAQPIGLPVADLAEPGTEGYPGFVAGASATLHGGGGDSEWASDASTFGIRGVISVLDELRLFGDLTLLNNEEFNTDMGLQLGALSPIPTDVADLALRATIYGTDGDKRNIVGGTFMVLWSTRTALEALAFYAGLGLDYKYEERHTGTGTGESNEFNPLANLGTLITLGQGVSLYAEVMYDDQWSVNGGLRIMR